MMKSTKLKYLLIIVTALFIISVIIAGAYNSKALANPYTNTVNPVRDRLPEATVRHLWCLISNGVNLKWYLAEGCTNGFDEYILIMNPNDQSASVKVTFIKSDGDTIEENITVGETSRYTVYVNDYVPAESVSAIVESTNEIPIIVERSMYWNSGDFHWGGGHCSKGITSLSQEWYLAEGCTDCFDEWVLIMNPNSQPASITVTFMKPDGNTVEEEITVPATSRYTIYVNEHVPDESVSTKLESNLPVAVERAMYWNSNGNRWIGGHVAHGITHSAQTWYLAEGCTNGFDEYILIMNPNNQPANVTVTFIKPDGDTVGENITVGSTSRYTIYVNDYVRNESVSTKITSDQPVIAERAMYWDSDTIRWIGGHLSPGTTAPSPEWYLAEGYTGGSFDEWILIMNPYSQDAETKVTFIKPDRNTVEENITVSATSRYTIHVDEYIPDDSVSTKVESLNNIPIIVERAMYWDSGGKQWAGGHACIGVKQSSEEQDVTVVSCLGNSITNGYPYAGTDNTYPARLDVTLESVYGYGSYNLINYGVNGYRADQVLADLQNLGWMSDDPDIVLLMVGGNDLAQEILPDLSNLNAVLNQTVAEVQAIVNTVTTHTNADGSHPKIIVSTFIPNQIEGVGGTAVVALYNSRLQSNLTGMDLLITTNWSDFYDSDTGQAKTSLMSDSIHPNIQGYNVLAENWYEAIDSLDHLQK